LTVTTIQNKEIVFENLGMIDYKKAWEYQESIFSDIIAQKIANRTLPKTQQKITDNYLLLGQHPHVYTIGKSGDMKNLLINKNQRIKKSIQFYRINRGGDITYHGPGQIVVYPIFDLDNFTTDIHLYLRTLEQAVINTLEKFGIKGERLPGFTGVWIDALTDNPRKICAIGVRSSRWVTMHGLALNVNTDLSFFDHIVPCGIKNKAVTSLTEELGKPQNLDRVAKMLISAIKEHFSTLHERPRKVFAGGF